MSEEAPTILTGLAGGVPILTLLDDLREGSDPTDILIELMSKTDDPLALIIGTGLIGIIEKLDGIGNRLEPIRWNGK